MSEKLYRIPLLSWKNERVFHEQALVAFTPIGKYKLTEGGILHHHNGTTTLVDGSDIFAAQRDYEQRLISAGVVEEVTSRKGNPDEQADHTAEDDSR